MSSSYQTNLINTVISLSESNIWKDAVQEWVIEDCEEDISLQSSCICGKHELRYLFTIRNSINKNILYPIGSSCIKKFERNELSEEASIREKLFKLYHAIVNHSFITLSNEFFSRKLLKYLYSEGVFKANKYNDNNPEKDYQFMLDMFNKKNKDSITPNQQSKINALIINSIRPYLVEQLLEKIK